MKSAVYPTTGQSTFITQGEISQAAITDTKKTLRYQAIAEHLCCSLNNEAVILSLENGKYYGVNPVGSRIWEVLQNSVSLSEIEQILLDEYNVSAEVCRKQITEFLNLMTAEGLVKILYESSFALS